MCNVQLIALILLERIVEDMLCSEFFQDWSISLIHGMLLDIAIVVFQWRIIL